MRYLVVSIYLSMCVSNKTSSAVVLLQMSMLVYNTTDLYETFREESGEEGEKAIPTKEEVHVLILKSVSSTLLVFVEATKIRLFFLFDLFRSKRNTISPEL